MTTQAETRPHTDLGHSIDCKAEPSAEVEITYSMMAAVHDFELSTMDAQDWRERATAEIVAAVLFGSDNTALRGIKSVRAGEFVINRPRTQS